MARAPANIKRSRSPPLQHVSARRTPLGTQRDRHITQIPFPARAGPAAGPQTPKRPHNRR